jgi:hypothetical protein
MTFTAEHYWQRVRRDHLNRGLVQANRHIAEGRLYVAKQTALIDGLDRDGHDSAMARELLAILHKSLQMHEGHREHIIRELELGRKLPVARGWHLFTTRYPSQRLSASLAHFDISSRAIKDSGNV